MVGKELECGQRPGHTPLPRWKSLDHSSKVLTDQSPTQRWRQVAARYSKRPYRQQAMTEPMTHFPENQRVLHRRCRANYPADELGGCPQP